MRFKPGFKYPDDFFLIHPLLAKIYCDMAWFCLRKYSVIPNITSILRPKTIDSGVHQTGRALDCSRHDYNKKGKPIYSIPEDKINEVLSYINISYPRSDGKDSLIWHNGTGPHFHLQVAYSYHFQESESKNIDLSQEREGIK